MVDPAAGGGLPVKRRGRLNVVSGDGFKEARLIAGFNRKTAAALIGVSERTVRNWEAGRVGVPYSAFKLMRILSGYALPGEAWAGWCLRGDTLWSPEQRPFRSHELSWWGLTVAMARAWRQQYQASPRAPVDGSHAVAQITITARDVAPGGLLSVDQRPPLHGGEAQGGGVCGGVREPRLLQPASSGRREDVRCTGVRPLETEGAGQEGGAERRPLPGTLLTCVSDT